MKLTYSWKNIFLECRWYFSRMRLYMFYTSIVVKFQAPTYNTFWDMNFFLVWVLVQTDAKWCIWAHRAYAQVGSKMEFGGEMYQTVCQRIIAFLYCKLFTFCSLFLSCSLNLSFSWSWTTFLAAALSAAASWPAGWTAAAETDPLAACPGLAPAATLAWAELAPVFEGEPLQ